MDSDIGARRKGVGNYIGDLVVTGPTLTNVNDIRLMIIT